MQSILPILQQQLPASADVQALLEEARQEVEALARERWTDYNTHDPGITILEQLAYAITDLGLRTGLDVEDYLAGKENSSLYSARIALPNAAYSPADQRRLLIDFKGQGNQPVSIRNAWVEAYASDIKGLSRWWIDLSPAIFGSNEIDLNAIWLKIDPISIDNQRTYEPYLVFPAWVYLSVYWTGEYSVTRVSLAINNISWVENAEERVIDQFYINEITLTFEGHGGTQQETIQLWVRLPNGIPVHDQTTKERVRQHLHQVLTNARAVQAFFQMHKARVHSRLRQLHTVVQFLRQHRNLCEDYGVAGTIGIQQIGVQMGRLELRPEADAVEVLARIYFLLDQFLDPPVQPYTFEDLRALDQTAADIFEGPLLENSFFPAAYLNPVERADKIYTSDLVRLIMQQPEVIGVDTLALDLYMDRIRMAKGVANCLHLLSPVEYKPKLSIEDSNATVVKGNTLVVIDKSRVITRYQELKKEFQAGFEYDNTGDLPIPQGDQTDLATFYSIQNEFPQVYGLRAGEVPADASPLRKAQAKQLKAYLLFFEQLMLNYCGQLEHLQELFSMRSEVERTYFYQPLYEVPAVQELFRAFLAEQELHGGAQPGDWEAFKNEANAYITALNAATEDRATFRQRRNQFLNHLLARLGEDFSDYEAWTKAQNGGTVPHSLLLDKLSFLQKAPELGSRRAVAFDYTATRRMVIGKPVPDVWDTNNVSGYEKRVAALLGIPDCRRRSLGSIAGLERYMEVYEETDRDGVSEKRFRLWNAPVSEVYRGQAPGPNIEVDRRRYKILLSSTKRYPRGAGLMKEVEKVKRFGGQERYYTIAATIPSGAREHRYYFNLLDDRFDREDPIARRIEYFPDRAAAEQAISAVARLVQEQGRMMEGLHLIEHILLRPINISSRSLQPNKFQAGEYSLPFITDAYSYQVSILLPGWAPRFRDREFRALAERTLRKELPAHVFAWIYWVEPEFEADGVDWSVPREYLEFEAALKSWLEYFNTAQRVPRQNGFIGKFEALLRSNLTVRTNTYTPFDIPHNV